MLTFDDNTCAPWSFIIDIVYYHYIVMLHCKMCELVFNCQITNTCCIYFHHARKHMDGITTRAIELVNDGVDHESCIKENSINGSDNDNNDLKMTIRCKFYNNLNIENNKINIDCTCIRRSNNLTKSNSNSINSIRPSTVRVTTKRVQLSQENFYSVNSRIGGNSSDKNGGQKPLSAPSTSRLDYQI